MYFLLLWIAAFAIPAVIYRYTVRRRRRAERANARMQQRVRDLEAQQEGGSPERPIIVASTAVIEGRAARFSCTACGGEVDVAEHRAEVIAGVRMRVARVSCRMCRLERPVYFRLTDA